MRVGIDTTTFFEEFDNGKEQVLLNLLKGFEDNGVGKQVSVLCYQNRYTSYKAMIPSASFTLLNDIPAASNIFMRIIHKLMNRKSRRSGLLKFVKESRSDVILFTNKRSVLTKLKIPTVVIPHDIQVVSHPERFELPAFIYKHEVLKDFKYSDIVISISDFDSAEMQQFFPKYLSKIRKIYNPIICNSNINTEMRCGIFALNVNYSHKNAITLLRAYNKIKSRISEKLIIAGKFNDQQCLAYIKDNNLTKDVLLTGYLQQDELQELMGQARLFVNPSLYEGFGMTPIEVIICGVPTLVYKGTASYETTQGLCEYYEKGTDADELAAKMLEILQAPLDLEALQKKSDILAKEYNYQNIANKYWQLFCELAEKNRA